MIRISQLKVRVKHTHGDVVKKVARVLKITPLEIVNCKIIKQSLDARKKDEVHYIYTLDVTVKSADGVNEETIVHKAENSHAAIIEKVQTYEFPVSGTEKLSESPVIIGSGPAGLFCGLMLARAGYCPMILERGEDVEHRTKTVDGFWQSQTLNKESNVQFGEGGAGAFSDGKLNTLVKDPVKRNQKVLDLLVEFGAEASVSYVNKPHIGTDVLCGIVKNIREEIIRLGGSVRFLSKVTELLIEQGHVTGVKLADDTVIHSSNVVLAIGHSARDTFEMLYKKQVPMEQKAFAVGLRIQHPQKMIDLSQYGKDLSDVLGAASYKLTKQTGQGRGVYSFCMCPGGYVVDASTEPGRLAINGMSYQARDGVNANSALIVTVTPEDFGETHPLAGIEYQRRLEEAAYQYGGGKIPVQLYGDFKDKRETTSLGDIAAEFKGGYQFADLRQMLPAYVSDALIEGMGAFDGMIKGFGRPDAVLAGIESRTSSPVRIHRDSQFESEIKGLFPCGEGAGYAGGINSAAMDGIKVAEELAKRYMPLK